MIENRTSHISKAGHLRDRCSPALLPQSLMFCNRTYKCTCIGKWDSVYVYRFFYGHHSGGNSFVYVNDFCYYRNCLYTTGTSTALKKIGQ